MRLLTRIVVWVMSSSSATSSSSYFHFQSNDGAVVFNAPLQCAQCTYVKPSDNQQCRRSACIGLPMCYSHIVDAFHVRIQDSTMSGAGKGLFAFRKGANPGDVVFFRKDYICPYNGEAIDAETLDARYGKYTAPYGMQLTQSIFHDAATKRGIGSLANHKPTRDANCRLVVNQRTKETSIQALKSIKHGEELFCNYGKAFRFNEPVQYSTNRRKYNV